MGTTKQIITKIAMILIIITLVDTAMPILNSNAGFLAAVTKWVAMKVFTKISRWLVDLGDVIIIKLQQYFIGDGEISNGSDVNPYVIRYSPGIIFSGKVPGLDVNFINPIKTGNFITTSYLENFFIYNDTNRGRLKELVSRSTGLYDFTDDLEEYGYSPDRIILKKRTSSSNEYGDTDTDTYTVWKYNNDYYLYVYHQYMPGDPDSSGSYTNKIYLYNFDVETELENYLNQKSGETPSEEVNSPSREINSITDLSEDEIKNFFIYNTTNWSRLKKLESQSNSLSSFDDELEEYGYNPDIYILQFSKSSSNDYGDTDTDKYTVWKYNSNYYLYVYHQYMPGDPDSSGSYSHTIYLYDFDVDKELLDYMSLLSQSPDTPTTEDPAPKMRSSAEVLQKSVATWYKIMMEIALVGLLCVLVYVAIRMIISSAAEDKAKYKKMLMDWVAAICIIFLMQFIMSITFTVSQSICNVFNANIIGEEGEDILMSGIRNSINIGDITTDENELKAFADNVIYLVLVVLTLLFTYQYLKRFIYVAFLTMIAPLVALTYPLDKIKDGQAQAYGMWLREFIFSVLIQPVHLIVYWIILGVAIDLVTVGSEAYNPIYAIVAISFMLPAEKFIRKMFGFEKSEAVSQIGSALGGAAIMSGVNKLGSAFKGKGVQGGPGGQNSGGENQGNGKIRTANNNVNGGSDPYAALRTDNGNGGNPPGGSSPGGNPPGGNTPGGSQPRTNNAPTPTPAQTSAPTPTPVATSTPAAGGRSPQTGRGATGKRWRRTKGAWNVATKYAPKLGKGAIKIAGAATLGTIGLAAGLTTGDTGKALAGLTGGLVAGNSLAGNLATGVVNLGKGANNVRRDIVDTFREGAYGKGEAEQIRFTKSAEYRKLVKDHPEQAGVAQELVEAGIRDTSKMGIALEGIKNGKYSAGEAAAYMRMAEAKDCPDEVLYSEEKFKKYLESRGIPTGNAENIRKGIIDFK